MNIRKPVPYDGMEFIFSNPSVQRFWNQNTHLDLQVYWIKNDNVIGETDLPSIDNAGQDIITSPQEVNKVVEIIK
jgi:uncharacterized membrane protein (UPF0127 family)